jgi:hypothetical protein
MPLNLWRGALAAVVPSIRPDVSRRRVTLRWKSLAIAFALACSGDRLLAPAPAVVGGTATLSAGPTVRISEFHYDNSGTDVGEAIEISGPAGTDLTGWRIVRYNGGTTVAQNNAATLSGAASNPTVGGTIPQSCGTRGVVVIPYPSNGIENGDHDGFALVDASNQGVEFLSYEGVITAASPASIANPAGGMTSVDVGVSESGSANGTSIQRKPDGTWILSTTPSFGNCNDDDSGAGAAVVASVTVTPTAPTAVVGSPR